MSAKLIVGLTGGIGSGKSLAADFFRELGVTVIDADVVARKVVESKSEALEIIVKKFGPIVLKSDGSLDRAWLRDKIFADSAARKWLEQLLHPFILATMFAEAQKVTTLYCVLVIPLLFECYDLIKTILQQQKISQFRILVIDAPQDLQVQRTQQRDQLTLEQAEKILAAQANQTQRLQIADDVIENNASIAFLKQQVTALHKVYTSLAT